MRILLSNDDGYLARGIRVLAAALCAAGHEVVAVAPDRNRSAASQSLTLSLPLRVQRQSDGWMAVEGTPADCVHLAVGGLIEPQADMVVSGINHGANLGDDVIYSGTVAAAIEGRFLGLPAIAVSLCDCDDDQGAFETAASVVVDLLARLQSDPLPASTILNVNVPNLPKAQLRGVRVARLGSRHRAEGLIAEKDPRGNPIYWVGPPGEEADCGVGTDFHGIREGYAVVTPLQVDLTHYARLDGLRDWLGRSHEV